MQENCFTENGFVSPGAGLFFSASQAPGTISTNVAHQNNISGNLTGAQYLGVETINADLNWWGKATGPTHPSNPGGTGDSVVDDGNGIDFMPFRISPASGTPCSAGPPAMLDLQPTFMSNPVDTEHCVTATVTDSIGRPVPDVIVRFSVTGSVTTSGSATTNASGEATFCYMGPSLPGADAIHAYADTNNSNTQDVGEPFGDATKAWTPPPSTAFCDAKITDGGWIMAANTDRANFGGNASVDKDNNATGQQEYQDQGPVQPMNVHSIDITATTCNPAFTEASIYGEATIDGSGMWVFRIDVVDSPSTTDRYRIRVMTMTGLYDSGDQPLKGGNITIHKQMP